MRPRLPAPEHARALLVCIEQYAGLGAHNHAAGAMVGALSFAQWLVQRCKVPAEGIELWMAPHGDKNIQKARQHVGLREDQVRHFRWEDFERAVEEPAGTFGTKRGGSFLIVYFCGHGLVEGPSGEQHLVLPHATKKQLRCLPTAHWQELFRAHGWERYRHQLWILDACRDDWDQTRMPPPAGWAIRQRPGIAVRQCTMFACMQGQEATIKADGPTFTRELLATLSATPTAPWPEFEQALVQTATRMQGEGPDAQSPVIVAIDWNGNRMCGPGLEGTPLRDMLFDIHWAFDEFVPYIRRALGAAGCSEPVPPDLDAALRLLDDLARVGRIPPVVDFALRVARAVTSEEIEAWVRDHLAAHHWEELKKRVSATRACARLHLWYREDRRRPCMEADLEILDAGAGVPAWQQAKPKPVTPDTVSAVVGQWLVKVRAHAGGLPMDVTIDLYLPRALLTAAAYDTATVRLDDSNELLLGDDHAVLLRCTDRYKAPTMRDRWQRHAPRILDRLGQGTANPVHWAAPDEDADELKGAFIGCEDPGAPVWLGFDPGLSAYKHLDAALGAGLPAVVWPRVPLGDGAGALQSQLRELLKTPLDALPAQLAKWRMRNWKSTGRTLALLLDDPWRLPPRWKELSQPGGRGS